ncbi:MAG: hypothetical protein ACLFPR_05120, partial [Desulfococcaceae bacterium]
GLVFELGIHLSLQCGILLGIRVNTVHFGPKWQGRIAFARCQFGSVVHLESEDERHWDWRSFYFSSHPG